MIKNSVHAIGFQVAFHYSLAGLACAWHYGQRARLGLGSLILF